MTSSETWDTPLQQLSAARIISGYSLITANKTVHAAYGKLSKELWQDDVAADMTNDSSSGAATLVDQIYGSFNGAAIPSSLTVLNNQLYTVKSDDCSFFAISRNKELGLQVNYLGKLGIVVILIEHIRANPTSMSYVLAAIEDLKADSQIL